MIYFPPETWADRLITSRTLPLIWRLFRPDVYRRRARGVKVAIKKRRAQQGDVEVFKHIREPDDEVYSLQIEAAFVDCQKSCANIVPGRGLPPREASP